MPVRLTDPERLAYAGLARTLVRLEGGFSSAEREALITASLELFSSRPPSPDPYRGSPAEPEATEGREDEVWALLERAAVELPDEASLRRAALAVSRGEARAAIFDALCEIASSDAIAGGEWDLLGWLEAAWELEPEAPGDEDAER